MSRPRAKRSLKSRRCLGLKLVQIGAFRRCCRVSDEKSTEETLDQIPPHILCWMTDGMVIKPILFNCTVPIGYSNLGYSGRAAYSDLNPRDEPPSVHK